MEIFLIKVLQFALALSILVLFHEAGHCIVAKLCGVRVEKFYLFFNPWFHLFEFKPRNSDTTYGIGWLPLGGYCKIAGMIDESMDTEQMKQPAQPWEFRSHPAWQRLLIMVAGVAVNFVMALAIYSGCLLKWGDDYIRPQDMTLGMKFNQEAKSYGFRDGDILLGTEKGEFEKMNGDVYRAVALAKRVDVLRDGEKVAVALPGNLDLLQMLKQSPPFMDVFTPATVDSVLPASRAEKLGMAKGDRIVAVDGKSIDSYNEFAESMGRHNDMLAMAKTQADSIAAQTVALSFVSAATGDTISRATRLGNEMQFGFVVANVRANYTVTHKSYGFLESIPAGISYGWRVLASYISDFRYLFSAEGAKSLGGFGTIGNLFPPVWDWHTFWLMTAFLSIILAFMNILPIPALDGGHVLFLLYEVITRRKPSDNFMIYAEYGGMGLLLLLLIVANMNDILRWLGLM